MATEKKMDYTILGLLSHETLTGYEIKKRIDTVLKYFWGASYGSIYPTLTALVGNGYATKSEYLENGRKKISYTITQNGREHLAQWLAQPVEKDEIRYETLLKLFFGSEVSPSQNITHIESFQAKIQHELPALMGAVETLNRIRNTEEAHQYYLLTAQFGVKVYTAYLEWCEEAKAILRKQEEA